MVCQGTAANSAFCRLLRPPRMTDFDCTPSSEGIDKHGGVDMTNQAAFQLRAVRFALLISLTIPISALADNWQVQVGADAGDKAYQALAFLPNEIWIHAGDSITWTFPTSEVHTVTFL